MHFEEAARFVGQRVNKATISCKNKFLEEVFVFAHIIVECKSGWLGNIFCFCGISGQLRLGQRHFETTTLFHRSTIVERSLTTFGFIIFLVQLYACSQFTLTVCNIQRSLAGDKEPQ